MSDPILKTYDTVSQDLQWKAQLSGNSGELNKVVAAAGAKVFREHFVKRAQVEKNKFGAPSRFWAKMRRLTTWKADSARATVIMPAEMRLKAKGGTVRPTGSRKALTIPTDRASYGRAARTFKDLFYVAPKKRGGKFLGALAQPTGKGTFRVLYTLVAFTKHKAKPESLPTRETLVAAVRRVVTAYVSRKGNA